MHWKYLLFDLDGTLTDPMQGITRSVQYALRHFGIEVEDLTTLCPFIGPPLRDSFREFYGMTSAQADEASEKYGEYFSRQGIFENKLYAGIPELLSALQAQGATLAIATSKPDFLAERIARHFGFRDRFTLICGGTAYGPCSTKAGVIRETLAQLRIDDPSQAVMIGDRRFDIEGAAAAGMESIGILWGYGSREELEKASTSQPTSRNCGEYWGNAPRSGGRQKRRSQPPAVPCVSRMTAGRQKGSDGGADENSIVPLPIFHRAPAPTTQILRRQIETPVTTTNKRRPRQPQASSSIRKPGVPGRAGADPIPNYFSNFISSSSQSASAYLSIIHIT